MKKNKENNNEIIETIDTSIENTMDDDVEIELDDFVSFVNIPKKDDKEYVKGKLVKIEKTEILNTKNKNSDEEDTLSRFRFKFIMEGTNGTINMNILTDTKLRHEKFYNRPKGKGKGQQENPEYNKFTEICLRLNIIKEKDLQEESQSLRSDIYKAIKSISTEKPIYIKAKLQKSTESSKEKEKRNPFETINIKSIKVIEAF